MNKKIFVFGILAVLLALQVSAKPASSFYSQEYLGQQSILNRCDGFPCTYKPSVQVAGNFESREVCVQHFQAKSREELARLDYPVSSYGEVVRLNNERDKVAQKYDVAKRACGRKVVQRPSYELQNGCRSEKILCQKFGAK